MKPSFRLPAFLRQRKLDTEMNEEMRLHLELQAERNAAAGMSAEEARSAALRQFGNVASIQERAREGRAWHWLEETLRDGRFAGRILAKSPGFAITAILTLGLGIGACTAMFSIVNSVLLQPLPFPEERNLVQIWESGQNGPTFPESLAYKYWREEGKLFESVALSNPWTGTLTGGPVPEHVAGLSVSANYLSTLGVKPLLGRAFPADAELPGGPDKLVMLTYETWRARFGGDPDVINRTIVINEVAYTVIGVLAPRALPRDDAQFLTPLVHAPNRIRAQLSGKWALVTARLKRGVTPVQAAAEATAIERAHAGEFGPDGPNFTAVVIPLREQLVGPARPTMLLLLGAGVLVLAIACANVANLTLLRATARTREMAVRAALGAGGRRLMRQVLVENLVLALLGGGLAVLLAYNLVDLLGQVAITGAADLNSAGPPVNQRLTGGVLPGMLQPRVDWTVLGMALAAAIATGIGCGAGPALRAGRAEVNRGLAGGRGTTAGGRTRLQAILVATEIAVAVVLLVGAGLFLRSFANVLAVDPGLDPRGVHRFDLAVSGAAYASGAKRVQFAREVVQGLGEQPRIAAACAATDAPFGSTGLGGPIGLAEETDRNRDLTTNYNFVDENFPRTLGLTLLRGRWLTRADDELTAPRALVITDALARALFREADPLGRSVAFLGKNWQVVGVARPTHRRSLETLTLEGRSLYAPLAFGGGNRLSVMVKSDLPQPVLRDTVVKTVRRIDALQPVVLRAMVDDIGLSRLGRQTVLVLVNVFAVIALALACLGIYGVMSYTVGQRRRELGIRLALGATQPGVVGLVLRDGLRLAAAGLGAGLVGALGGVRLIASQLFGIGAYDGAVFGLSLLILAAVALLACWLPARRAARVDPMVALRAE